MKISDINYELSIRLGDPVLQPDSAGYVFSSEERFKYITRAYSKLSRMLKILMRDYQPEFNKRRKITIPDLPDAFTNTLEISSSIKVEEVFVTYKIGSAAPKTAPVAYMEASKYLSNKYGVNDVKGTSFADAKFKYTVMVNDNKTNLIFLPEATKTNVYTKVEYLEVPNFEIVNWEDEIPITSDYIDLLIDLAAIQGMQDIARADKAQLIERSIDKDWQILGQYGTYMKQTEGVKE
ncbi:MAG TPA: hypothetical protein VMV86_01740 [Methanosarcinales archaeon]|nr:hypothetical protein [Methanosarcinales archaeon]